MFFILVFMKSLFKPERGDIVSSSIFWYSSSNGIRKSHRFNFLGGMESPSLTKKTHVNNMCFTCVAHVNTCDSHVNTCGSHVDKFRPHVTHMWI